MIANRLTKVAWLAAAFLIVGVGLVACSGDTTTAPQMPEASSNWETEVAALRDMYGSDPLWTEIEPLLERELPGLQKRSWGSNTRLFLAFQRTTIELVPPFPPPILTVLINYDGFGTLLGRHTGSSLSSVDVTVIPNIQSGVTTLIAADGDQLVCDYSGIATPGATPADVNFEGSFTVTGGTGRFAGATGSGSYMGSADQAIGEGQIIWYGLVNMSDD